MDRHRDALTGLPNREALQSALQHAVTSKSGFALAVLDLDNFMAINTTLGAEIGDRILRALAAQLKREAPEGAYRFSGDEFALILPGVNLEQAFLHMEKLRSQVQESAPEFDLPDKRPVSVTIGVAQYPRDAKDVQGLFNAADAALLAAKENGRNQVGLPPAEEMVMKSCYYPATGVRKLKALSERLNQKESYLLREALSDLLRKHDVTREL